MSKIVLALDVEKDRAVEIINKLSGYVEIYKIGHKLFTSNPELIDYINKKGKKVLLDLKYHDIPSVIGLAVEEAAKRFSPFGLTLHTSGSRKMMASAVEAKNKLAGDKQPILFGVTVLTSLDMSDLESIGVKAKDVAAQVTRLARLAKECNLDGIVCSGHEIEQIKSICGREFKTLVPGLSLTADANKDQKRTFTVKDAISKGADYIVVGRAIYESPDPIAVVKQILSR